MASRLPAALLLAVLLQATAAAPAAAQRLSGEVVPSRYELWFAPDFATDTFRGRTSIAVAIAAPTTTITLHAAELAFDAVTIEAGGRAQAATIELDPEAELATFRVPEPLPAGQATIQAVYTGILNDRLRGFYRSEANGREYAVTQLQATDARRAFPSFDEPEYKATFAVSLMVDEGDTAISNGALLSDTPGPEPGKHTLVFEETLRMSSYLVAMFVGDFVCAEGGVGDTPIRVCATPDKIALTGFALEAAEQQLAWFNDYFGIRYPFAKIDVLAIPDFAAGAMENTGAISFREQFLLIDADTASLGLRKTVAGILAHEIAHMWTGDLVTMHWWDDIWLNEGFATWLEKKPLADWRPDWNVELDEARDTQGAVSIDALQATRPVRVAANTPEEINEVFDGIAYEKAAAVLRMVEAWVGPDRFRDAVRAYVRRYAFDTATAEDLWIELTRVTGAPVDEVLRAYIDQPGVPVLGVAASCAAGDTRISLTQERFSGTPNTSAGPESWTIPVCVADPAGGAPRCEVMRGPAHEMTIPGCAGAPFVNAGATGYYLTEYAPEAVGALAARAGDLSPAERIALLGDEWWMLQAGRHDAGAFLDLAAALAADPTAAITATLSQRLGYTATYLVPPGRQSDFQTWVRARFGPELTALGVAGAAGDDDALQARRASLLGIVGAIGNDGAVQAEARALAERYMANPDEVPGTLVATVLGVAAAGGGAPLYDRYLAALDRVASNPEQYYRYFNALLSFTEPALVTRTLEYALSPAVRAQDSPTLLGGLLGQPATQTQAWEFIRSRWADVEARLGDTFGGIQSVVGSLGTFCSANAAAGVEAFFAANPAPAAERALGRALERIRTCAAIQARQLPAVGAWLDTRP